MKNSLPDFPHLYEAALRSHLEHGARADTRLIGQTGGHLRTSGIPLLDFARLHEHLLVMELLPACPARKRSSMIRNSGNFFAAVIGTEIGEISANKEARLLGKAIESLSGRTVELASANRLLGLEITQRKNVEAALRTSEQDLTNSLKKSEILKDQLRGLSRQILTVQEEERKKISRELHDVVAQALLGINVRLAALRVEAGLNTKDLDRNISQTQRMITKSANIVHQFARELRPAALDDLGLMPALQSFMKHFTTRTGVRTHLAFFQDVEKLSAVKRTVLYRVAQEALTNVSRHAKASRVDVTIRRETKFVIMEVSDNGKALQTQRVILSGVSKGLGLLGMRERVEMVGGIFRIETIPGEGTKITARIPVSKTTERKWRLESAGNQPEKT
jgi:signal transduction histidine kinase